MNRPAAKKMFGGVFSQIKEKEEIDLESNFSFDSTPRMKNNKK